MSSDSNLRGIEPAATAAILRAIEDKTISKLVIKCDEHGNIVEFEIGRTDEAAIGFRTVDVVGMMGMPKKEDRDNE